LKGAAAPVPAVELELLDQHPSDLAEPRALVLEHRIAQFGGQRVLLLLGEYAVVDLDVYKRYRVTR
jgi:hypothetical protein